MRWRAHSEELEIRSPLELHLPGAPSADGTLMAAIYDVCLRSVGSPGQSKTADRVRTAIRWLAKRWKNTNSIDFADRIVFLTGGAFTHRARLFLDEVKNPRLDKPFDADILRAAVRGLIP